LYLTTLLITMYPDKFGRYIIEEQLGRGGMSVVYLANDPRVKRRVAVKVMNLALTDDPIYRNRFKREAEIIASLEHSNIVPIYDFGEHNGQPYIVMRAMFGGSLTDQIKFKPIFIRDVIRILRSIAPALDKAHDRGIIHRDLKPGNILFDEDEEPYLTDFGVAHLSQALQELTGSGALIGTPAYMSPEQVQSKGDLDGRSDIYALGVILFEMLTGSRPYQADTPIHLALKHIQDPIPNILNINPSLPPRIDEVIYKALAKDRIDRYPTAIDMADDLAKVYFASTDTPIFDNKTIPPSIFLDPPQTKPPEQGIPPSKSPAQTPPGEIYPPQKLHQTSPFDLDHEDVIPAHEQITIPPTPDQVLSPPPLVEQVEEGSFPQFPPAVAPSPKQTKKIRPLLWAFGGAAIVLISLALIFFGDALWRPNASIAHDVTPTFSPTPSQDAIAPLQSPTLTISPPTNTPIPTLTSTITPEPAPDLLPITIKNIENLVELDRLGNGTFQQLSVSPDGKNLAVASTLGIYLYNIEALELTELLETHTKIVNTVAWSPNGDLLASGGDDGAVYVRDIELERELFRLEDLGGPITSLAWSPDGKMLAAGSEDKNIYVWEMLTGRLEKQLFKHESAVNVVAWSPDGKKLATAGWYINVWDLSTWRADISFGGHFDLVTCLEWSHDSYQLMSSSKDGTVRVWDFAENDNSNLPLSAPDEPILSIALNPTTGILAIAKFDQIELFNFENNSLETIVGHTAPITDLSWTTDGTLLISISEDGTLRVWSQTGEELRQLTGFNDIIHILDWSPDTTRLAFSDGENNIRIWETSPGTEQLVLEGHLDKINTIAWSPDGLNLASGSDDRTARIWNATNGKLLYLFSAQEGIIYSVAWSPDGSILATGSEDGTVVLWNPTTGEEIHRISQPGVVRDIDWTTDGKKIAFGCGNDVWVRETATGLTVIAMRKHIEHVNSVAWDPDGDLIISGGEDKTIRYWSTSRGLQLQIKYQAGAVNSVLWTPEGSLWLTTGKDGILHFWDASENQEIFSIKKHRGPITQALLSSDGNKIGTLSDDGTFRIWGVPSN
jgi:WD40 repeat protein/serine/threonine protein kinase